MNRSRAPAASAQAERQAQEDRVARRHVGDRNARLHAVLRDVDIAGQRRARRTRRRSSGRTMCRVGKPPRRCAVPHRSRPGGAGYNRRSARARRSPARVQAPRTPSNRARRKGARPPSCLSLEAMGAMAAPSRRSACTKEGPPVRRQAAQFRDKARLGGKRAKSGTSPSYAVQVKPLLNETGISSAIPNSSRLKHVMEGRIVRDSLRFDSQRPRREQLDVRSGRTRRPGRYNGFPRGSAGVANHVARAIRPQMLVSARAWSDRPRRCCACRHWRPADFPQPTGGLGEHGRAHGRGQPRAAPRPPRSLGLSLVRTGSSAPFSTKSLTCGEPQSRFARQRPRARSGSFTSKRRNRPVMRPSSPDHRLPLILRETGDDRADIFRIAAAAPPQRHRLERANLLLLVEQAPDQIVERQARIRQLLRLHRSGQDRDVRPVGMVEPRVQPLAALLAFGQMLEQQAAGDPMAVALFRPPDARGSGSAPTGRNSFAPHAARLSPSSGTIPW